MDYVFNTKVEHATARQTDILQIYNKSKPKKEKKNRLAENT